MDPVEMMAVVFALAACAVMAAFAAAWVALGWWLLTIVGLVGA